MRDTFQENGPLPIKDTQIADKKNIYKEVHLYCSCYCQQLIYVIQAVYLSPSFISTKMKWMNKI